MIEEVKQKPKKEKVEPEQGLVQTKVISEQGYTLTVYERRKDPKKKDKPKSRSREANMTPEQIRANRIKADNYGQRILVLAKEEAIEHWLCQSNYSEMCKNKDVKGLLAYHSKMERVKRMIGRLKLPW